MNGRVQYPHEEKDLRMQPETRIRIQSAYGRIQ